MYHPHGKIKLRHRPTSRLSRRPALNAGVNSRCTIMSSHPTESRCACLSSEGRSRRFGWLCNWSNGNAYQAAEFALRRDPRDSRSYSPYSPELILSETLLQESIFGASKSIRSGTLPSRHFVRLKTSPQNCTRRSVLVLRQESMPRDSGKGRSFESVERSELFRHCRISCQESLLCEAYRIASYAFSKKTCKLNVHCLGLWQK